MRVNVPTNLESSKFNIVPSIGKKISNDNHLCIGFAVKIHDRPGENQAVPSIPRYQNYIFCILYHSHFARIL